MINFAFINCAALSLRFLKRKIEFSGQDYGENNSFTLSFLGNNQIDSKQKVLIFTLSIFSALLNFEKKKEDDGF